jgi:ribosome-associated heat shock protein Hsp15
MSETNSEDRHRIDVWLKHVCLFKHRSDATEACRGGLVKINGLRVKPAAKVSAGDVVEFMLGTVFRRVVVTALPVVQAAKDAARAMYVDESPKTEKPDVLSGVFRERGAGRPTKKERRDIEKVRR